MLSLDVRADDSVHACIEAVSRRCGYLDVLINKLVTSWRGSSPCIDDKVAKAFAFFETVEFSEFSARVLPSAS